MTREVIAFDTETHLIKKANEKVSTMLVPRMVCLSWATLDASGLLSRRDGLDWLEERLVPDGPLLVGANTPYDLAVATADRPRLVRAVFRAYRDGRIRCVQTRQRLIDIAKGELKFRSCRGSLKPTSWTLAALVDYWLGEHLEKEDTWRLRYSELDNIPITEWPEDAKSYALTDAQKTYDVWMLQDDDIHRLTGPWLKRGIPPLNDEEHQNRAAWALHLAAVWGVRTDPKEVEVLADALDAEHDAAMAALKAVGLVRANGTRDTKAIAALVEAAFKRNNEQVPRTPTGKVEISAAVLDKCGDPHLDILSSVAACENVRNSWLDTLKAGTTGPICARYNSPLETGRVSCSSPNMMNPPRGGGVRGCFRPRPGYLFVACDYDTLELRTLAQECIELVGHSAMADALKRGEDLHLALAAELLGITMAEATTRFNAGDKDIEEKRQLCKIANFGFPGGMVPRTFVEYAGGYGVKIDLNLATTLWQNWKRKWPEMDRYFALIKGMLGPLGEGTVMQSGSKRLRGKVGYCAACNTKFQGRAADGAKEALWRCAVEMYTGERTDGGVGESPLWGARTVVFMHDEIIAEVPELNAAPAAERLGEVMREAMQSWVPDVPIKCSPVLMRRWYKGAKAVKVDGVLAPSRPEKEKDERGKERTKWVHDLGGAQ